MARTPKKKEESERSWIKIVALWLGAPAALAALIPIYQFLKTPDEIQIVAATVERTGRRPTLRATVRNTSPTAAVLNSAELVFESATVTDATTHATTELQPVAYNWILTLDDVARKTSTLQLGTRLEKQEPDALEFILGFEKRHATFTGGARLRLHYNDDQVATSRPFEVSIVNAAGDFPQFNFPKDSTELSKALRTLDAPFALRQVIDELAKRRFAPASPDVQRLFLNADPTVRSAAAEYFVEVRDSAATAGLATLVEATDASVRRHALKALVS